VAVVPTATMIRVCDRPDAQGDTDPIGPCSGTYASAPNDHASFARIVVARFVSAGAARVTLDEQVNLRQAPSPAQVVVASNTACGTSPGGLDLQPE
jgi:hypothetical protein